MEKRLTYKSIIDCLASMRDVQDIVAIDEHNYAPYHLCRARLKLKLKFECAFPNSHCFATRYKCVATINVDDEDRALDQYVARLLQLLLLLPPLVFALLLLYLQGLLSVATQVISVTACARIKMERLRSRADYGGGSDFSALRAGEPWTKRISVPVSVCVLIAHSSCSSLACTVVHARVESICL
jgi:hypothetical protein